MIPMSYFDAKGIEVVVKVPEYKIYDDYDFIGFSFNNKHSCEDLHIFRVSSGNRYQEELNPQRKERTAQHAGNDYTHYLGEDYGPRQFKIDFAFEGLNDKQIQAIRDCFDDKDIRPLWFDEAPYKVYEAKVQGQVVLKVIPFGNSNEAPTYSGEGSVTFVCYCPYARTPDLVVDKNGEEQGDGRALSSYSEFKNMEQWKDASRLQNTNYNFGRNFGDIPAPFIYQDDSIVTQLPNKTSTQCDIMELKIGTGEINFDIITNYPTHYWNSYNGILTAKHANGDKKNIQIYSNGKKVEIAAKSVATLPVTTQVDNNSPEQTITWKQYRSDVGDIVTYWITAAGGSGYTRENGTSTSIPSLVIGVELCYHYWYY